MTHFDLDKPYCRYAQDVLDGNIVACESIRLACQRFKDWFSRDDIYFDYEDVDHKIRFTSKMKHFTDVHNKQPFILLGWQSWVYANVFGFKYVEDGLRVITNVFILISRKNGKTSLAAALGLCVLCVDNQPNAEVEIVANSRQQASIGLNMCREYAKSLDPKNKLFDVYRGRIDFPKTKSFMQVLSSDAMGNDGYNSAAFILDEWHAAKDYELYNAMKSSQGMRRQPLAIVISTAGFLLAGYPCYDTYVKNKRILRGELMDDSTFSAIYELDEGDDWTDENVWLKCCPSLGQTVTVKYMREQVTAAKNNTSLSTGIKTKNFNMWCSTETTWIDQETIQKSMRPVDLSMFPSDTVAFCGADLAAVRDIAAYATMVPYDGKLWFKTFYYLPQDTIDNSPNSSLYRQWVRDGYLTATSGNVTDYDFIVSDATKVQELLQVLTVNYDRWNAASWSISMQDAGFTMQAYSQTLGSFNMPTKEFERLMLQGKIVIDYNPVTLWMFDNVILKTDTNENVKPFKNSKDQKIDGVIAMLEALGGMLMEPAFSNDVIFLSD